MITSLAEESPEDECEEEFLFGDPFLEDIFFEQREILEKKFLSWRYLFLREEVSKEFEKLTSLTYTIFFFYYSPSIFRQTITSNST